jgi:peptidoglycan/LPS O-acetylase OafA/YrhL
MDGATGESRLRIRPDGPADHGQITGNGRAEKGNLSAVACGAQTESDAPSEASRPLEFSPIPPLVREPRYLSLDIWRGIACVMVVLHHASYPLTLDLKIGSGIGASIKHAVIRALWHMNIGVPLFFVISGYCIAGSVDAARRRGTGSLAFLSRRFWRIYPPYWAAILCFIAATSFLDAIGLRRLHEDSIPPVVRLFSLHELNAAQWLGNMSLTEGWRPLVWPASESLHFTRVSWSLGYEEQFYFVCFLALLAFPKRLFLTLAAMTAVFVSLRITASGFGQTSRIDGSFPMLWHEFAVGLAVYWRLNLCRSRTGGRVVEATLVVLAVCGLLGGFVSPSLSHSTAAAGTFGLVLIALRRWDARVQGMNWLRPLQACGRRCYSMYLIHLPICTIGSVWLYETGLTTFWQRALITIPAVCIASVAGSWLFFWTVERHFLNKPVVNRTPRGPRANLLELRFRPQTGAVETRPAR